jgi:hypothetical protein
MSHLVTVAVRRMFGDNEVNFTTQAADLASALVAAHTLAGIDTPTAPAASSAPPTDTKATTEKPKAEGKPKTEAKKQTADSASSQSGAKQETTAQQGGAQEKTSSTTAAQPSSGGDEVTYDGHVKPAILTIAKEKGRDIVTALLQRFGAGKGPDLKPEQFADFHRDAQRVLAGEWNPMDADEEALA